MTVFCDIDNTLLSAGNLRDIYDEIDNENYMSNVLDGVHDFIEKVITAGGKIILTTNRPEILKYQTEEQLRVYKICYHELIMGCPSPRYVINNKSADGDNRAFGINVEIDEGLANATKEIFGED